MNKKKMIKKEGCYCASTGFRRGFLEGF